MTVKYFKKFVLLFIVLVLLSFSVNGFCRIQSYATYDNGTKINAAINLSFYCENQNEFSHNVKNNTFTLYNGGGPPDSCDSYCGNVYLFAKNTSLQMFNYTNDYPLNSSNEVSWTSNSYTHLVNVTLEIDNKNPLIEYQGATPANASYVNSLPLTQSVLITDINLDKINFYLWNSTYTNLTTIQTIIDNTTYTIPDGIYSTSYNSLAQGPYSINASTCDIWNQCNSTDVYDFVLDLSAPKYYNIQTPADTRYQPINSFIFNATWNDTISYISDVIFNFNGINYTIPSANDDYNYTVSNLPAGTYPYYWWANDSATNENQTLVNNFIISKDICNPTLLLNGTASNFTSQFNSDVNITTYRGVGENDVFLYVDGVLYDQGVYIENITTFTTPGLKNITAVCTTSQNYTGNFTTYFVKILSDTSSILDIWDSTDYDKTGNFFALINVNQKFYANYSNYTDAINPADCKIKFSDTSWISMTYNSSGFYEYQRSFISAGTKTYDINCTSSNYQNKTAQGDIVISDIDTINPYVVLENPPDDTSTYENNITFGYRVSDNAASKFLCSLYHNASGTFLLNSTKLIEKETSGIARGTFDITLGNGNYEWNVKCNDGQNTEFATNNWSINIDNTIPDSVDPIITLIAPPDKSTQNKERITFVYSVTDNIATSLECNLYLNNTGWNIIQTHTVFNGDTDTFNYNLVNTNWYEWNVECEDGKGNKEFASG